MGVIYKITNLINNKSYIGKTMRTAEIRWQEHIAESKKENNIPLYNAFNKYGIKNFSFQILEEHIPNSLLNEKEKDYIKQYNSLSHENGYNVTIGGDGGRTSSKLTEADVEKIYLILLDSNDIRSYEEIGQQFNISKSVIININNGNSWYNKTLQYPLRKENRGKITLSRDCYQNIIQDLKNNDILMKDIQKKYNISEEQLTSINYGRYSYSKDGYYKNIYYGEFPIRKPSNEAINFDSLFINILYEILFTKKSMAKIGMPYGIKGNTLTYIAAGKRRKELTKNYKTPLRNFLEENKKIFQKENPNYNRKED